MISMVDNMTEIREENTGDREAVNVINDAAFAQLSEGNIVAAIRVHGELVIRHPQV
jgi:predicted N-acetyltransferase YhbS